MQVETEDKVLFWQDDSVFSNWYPAKFEMHGYKFKNSEAAFMFLKAEIFNDQDIMGKILKNQAPSIVKKLGREIKGFNEETWATTKEYAMYIACMNKFGQNPELLQRLRDTGTKTLVEASPFDKIWGIGLAPDDEKAKDETKWQGMNLLGKVLMKVRADITD